MCETAGFIPASSAGKDVRCANPECKLPIFKAPLPQRKSSNDTATIDSKKSSTALVMTLLIGGVLLLGGGAWFFLSGSSPVVKQKRAPHPGASEGDEEPVVKTNGEEEPTEAPPPAEVPITLAEVGKTVLDNMVAASQNPNQNRSKPFCRQSTAETYAAVNELGEARNQLERLRDVGKQLPYYQVMPLVSIAWQELKARQTAEAKKLLDQAVAVTKQPPGLPPYGSESLNIASNLAAALAASGRLDEAREILQSRTETGTLADLVALWRAAFDSRSYDFQAFVADQPLSSGAPPQWATVARSLAYRGYFDAALAWAEGSGSQEIRVDCTMAWAEALVDDVARQKQPERLKALDPAAAKLTPAGKARLYARLAGRSINGIDQAQIDAWLKIARDTIATIGEPTPMTVPGMAEIHNTDKEKLPDPSNLRLAALASAELARVEAKLGQKKEAWASVNRALNYLRGTAPPVPAIQVRVDEIEAKGAAVVREELKSALKLRNDDEAFHALPKYRRNAVAMADLAKASLQLQTAILIAAAEAGLRNEVWNEARSRQSDKNRQEPYFETPLPAVLADAARQAKESELADAVENAVGKREEGKEREADLRILLQQKTTQLVAQGSAREAAREIESFRRIDKTWRTQWTLQLLSGAIKAGKVEESLQFISALEDQIARELLLEATGALAARLDHGKTIFRRFEESTLPSTEQVALGRGLILGLLARTNEALPVLSAGTTP